MEKQSSERRFALLIDADNVSSKYIKPITDELSNYGTVTYKRIYGDWTLTLHAKWKDALLENSITPIQQFGYTQGKNATDSAMIIDAMDILYTRSVEGFCIVSSDSDFTRLASRIRESGLTVIGMGEKKTPTPFRKACDIFTTLELLLGDSKGSRSKSRPDQNSAAASPSTGLTIDELEQAVVNIITDNQNNGKSTGLGEVGSRLLKRYPDFDVRSYGTNLLSKLLDEFASVQITKEGSSVTVELAVDAERERKNSRSKDAHLSRVAQANSDNAAVQPAERPVSSAESAALENAAAVEKDAPVVIPASRTAPEKRPRRSTRVVAKHVTTGGEPSKEPVEAPAMAEPSEVSVVVEEAFIVSEQVAPIAPEKLARQAPVDNRPGRAGRKKVVASHAPTTKRSEQKASLDVRELPSRMVNQNDSRGSELPKSDQQVSSSDAKLTTSPKPAGTVVNPQAFIRQAAADAGSEGAELAALGKRVRAKFRTFKLRDLGYSQFRPYVADIEGVTVKEREGRFYACIVE